MTTAYALTIDLPQPLTIAIETLRAALAAEQMGIVSEVDVQATLKAKLGAGQPPAEAAGHLQPQGGPRVRAWFENLLPDSKDIRERMARRYRADSTDAFDLLADAGRDCAGALQILPDRTKGTASSRLMGARRRQWSTISWRERLRRWRWCARSCRTASRQTWRTASSKVSRAPQRDWAA